MEKNLQDEVVDLRGECCPIPEMTASKKLRKMTPGQTLVLLTDHQPAVEVTLPALAKTLGYPISIQNEGDAYRVRITKR